MTPFTATTHEAATIARAGIGGTVTIVRRLKAQPDWVQGDVMFCNGMAGMIHTHKLPLSPGKPVWVKEGWWFCSECGQQNFMAGANRGGSATGVYCVSCDAFKDVKTDPAITMPRWASRFTLTPETVRVCRVQDVTEDEAADAGADWTSGGSFYDLTADLRNIVGPAAWDRNDWVMVALCKIGGVE